MTTHTLDVPGALLYYERRGSGPLLLMIGSPMDSTGFAGLAEALAGQYTVVTYDPRGIGNSTREDTTVDITPEQQADDVHRLLGALGEPAYLFGSSGGGTVGLALVTAHPDAVRVLVAHEPPTVQLLPDREEIRDRFEDIYATYRSQGMGPAMQMFLGLLGVVPGEQPPPAPEQMARMQATSEVFLAHLIRPTSYFSPDVAALRKVSAPIVIGVGATAKGQLAHRAGLAMAEALGTTAVEFPGDHGGFVALPEEFGRVLDDTLKAVSSPST